MSEYVLALYKYFPLEVDYARGIYIYSKNKEVYIDTFSGIGVTNFGHSNPDLINVLTKKIERYTHLSNYFLDEDAEYVSEKLVGASGKKGKVFYCNSGTEATEAVLKAIKKISDSHKNKIIYFKNSFHGRTTGSLSINGFDSLKKSFYPLLDNTIELEFNNIPQFEKFMEIRGNEVIGVFVEPVLGSGGIHPMTEDFAGCINKYKEIYKYIVVSDEIQAGLGRTGYFYSYQNFRLDPDIITTAKSLGGGIPLGSAIFLERTTDILNPGDHGTTFGPNPIALAGARYIVDSVEKIIPEVRKKSEYFLNELRKLNNPKIKEIRGKGLMIGIELLNETPELTQKGFNEKILLNMIGNKVIRLLPPLNIEYEEIDIIVKKINKIIN